MNVFACLVHESPECVADLVDNLRSFDPASPVLLYDGSKDGSLLSNLGFAERDAVFVHPQPKPMEWGALHWFGVDSMRFAIDEIGAETITVVDSDQLAVRSGYSGYISSYLGAWPEVGCLSSEQGVQPRTSRNGAVQVAWREFDLWRPFLKRFPDGERKFPQWSFWPATVFTRKAALDVVDLFEDGELQSILSRSRMWAVEEIVLPSLVALSGYHVVRNPCSYDFVRYRATYTTTHIEKALARSDVYWIHPVPRRYDDPIRTRIRARGEDHAADTQEKRGVTERSSMSKPLRALPILAQMESVEGWFTRNEGDLLLGAAVEAVSSYPSPHNLVEVGSYCGRSTIVLGSVARALDPPGRVFAIDPHEGVVGAEGTGGLAHVRPTFERFLANLSAAGLLETVQPIKQYSFEVEWDAPITLLLLDGLHDYASVACDFSHFQRWVVDGGLIAFHDYSERWPGVKAFVDHLLDTGACEVVGTADSLMLVRKVRNLDLPSLHRVMEEMKTTRGWLEPDEGAFLALTAAGVASLPGSPAIVEVGSYCGRGTTVLGSVVLATARESRPRVVAIDTFDGTVGALGAGLFAGEPTLREFTQSLERSGIVDIVEVHEERASDIEWTDPIGLLVLDGLHDFASVSADFQRLGPHVVAGGFIALHDYASYYPGVRALVSEILRRGGYRRVGLVGTMLLLQKEVERPSIVGEARAADVPTGGHAAKSQSRDSAAFSQPLVSCIMPTFNRPQFVSRAIAYFMRQDYAQNELVVIDDGSQPVQDLIPDDGRVTYVRLDHRLTIGAKRNIGCERARGDILVHWDDDDWFAPWRLRYQVEALLSADADICGLSTLLYWDPSARRAWRYSYPSQSRPWVHDPTFCYRRALWQANPFPDTNFGLDTIYLWRGARKRVLALEDPTFYVGIVHGHNTSPKRMQPPWWQPWSTDELRLLLGVDAASYEVPEALSDALAAVGRP